MIRVCATRKNVTERHGVSKTLKLLRVRRIELLDRATFALDLASVDAGQHRETIRLGGLRGSEN